MTLTRFDPAKGCSVLAGEKPLIRPRGCKCHPDSPFLWAQTPRDSFAMEDRTMRTLGQKGLSATHTAALNAERMRVEGRAPELFKAVSRKREEELKITRFRDFKTYSKVRTKEKK